MCVFFPALFVSSACGYAPAVHDFAVVDDSDLVNQIHGHAYVVRYYP